MVNAWTAKNKDRMRTFHLRYLYGLTTEEFETLLHKQNGRCAICGTDKPGGKGQMAVDHDHATGKVRGLLCSSCNMALGIFGDSETLLVKALAYLRSAALEHTV